MARTIDSIEALGAFEGKLLGTSDWVTIDQPLIDAFAELTGDRQWIHVDEERARRSSPFGRTVAHGYLILSMIPEMIGGICRFDGPFAIVNMGFDRVRFINPVPSGSRIRMEMRVIKVTPTPRGTRVLSGVRIEIEDREMPACVAEILFSAMPAGPADEAAAP